MRSHNGINGSLYLFFELETTENLSPYRVLLAGAAISHDSLHLPSILCVDTVYLSKVLVAVKGTAFVAVRTKRNFSQRRM